MGLPTADDNLEAYESSDVTRMVENFKNKEFFLIHGTADDNVHYQQSMMLARALEKADILFSSQVICDEHLSKQTNNVIINVFIYHCGLLLRKSLKFCLFQSYPDENHGLAGVKLHHYHSMEHFLNGCFNIP